LPCGARTFLTGLAPGATARPTHPCSGYAGCHRTRVPNRTGADEPCQRCLEVYDTVSYTFVVRGEAREQAILAAVIGLLGEAGYEAMTMDAVAARAHASKTTIYRRWRGKPELVKAAVDGYVAGRVPSWADTGSLRGDLMTVMLAMRGHLTDEFLAMMSGLIHAMRTEPELAAVLRSHLASDHSAALPIIQRAAGRDEVPAGAEEALASIAHEVIEAQLFRQMAVGGSFDEPFARHVVDDLVLPALIHYREGKTGCRWPRWSTRKSSSSPASSRRCSTRATPRAWPRTTPRMPGSWPSTPTSSAAATRSSGSGGRPSAGPGRRMLGGRSGWTR